MPESRMRRGLARHLVLTYVLLTLVVGGLLTWVSVWSVGQLEAHLQRIDMGMAVERVRGEYLAGVDTGRPNRFFHGEAGGAAFPDWLRRLAPGFHKLEHDGRLWHVIVDDHEGQRYMLLRDYTEYERNQSLSHWTTVSGLAAGLMLAFVLGTLATRRMLRPLGRLAAQVSARGAQPPQTRLAEHYPPDEIGQLAAAFDATYNQLEQALQREQLFTADVSHELRTPLMVIFSSCELLREDVTLDPAAQARLARIEAAATDMRERLDTYLMLARGRDAADVFKRESTVDVVRLQQQAWQSLAARRSMTLELEEVRGGSADDEAAPTYPAPLLRAVLSNLIRNALQYAGSPARIVLRAGADFVEVADNGPGIAPERQATIFNPFVRGSQPDSGNLGLGLSLVQRICGHQGWRVSLRSAPGEGTVFRVDLAQQA